MLDTLERTDEAEVMVWKWQPAGIDTTTDTTDGD